jgi:V/A-type H+/Na+-transporting ATPase subunit D
MTTEKIKYNKTELKTKRDQLAKYEKFLPILQLKKMQLQIVLRQLEPVIEERQAALSGRVEETRPWARLLSDEAVHIHDFLEIEEVRTVTDNIAGVEVPDFEAILFRERPYSLFSTPAWLDTAILSLRGIIAVREEIRLLRKKEALIREELRITTQRCNLFEKKLIPDLKEEIRKIKIFLGDQETAAVGRAKIAKAKTRELEEAPL